MFDYLFTFRSLTQAQGGRRVLAQAGIWVSLERSPRALSAHGCGYVLRVRSGGGMAALELLRDAGGHFSHLYRSYQNGQIQEVRL